MIDQATFRQTQRHITTLFQEHTTVTSQIHDLRMQLLGAGKAHQILTLEQRLEQEKFEIQQKTLLMFVTGLLLLSLWGMVGLLFSYKIIVANLGLVIFLAGMIGGIGFTAYRIWTQILSVKSTSQELINHTIAQYEKTLPSFIEEDAPIVISSEPTPSIKRVVPKKKK